MVRISNAGEKWSNCSPGRLIIERTMAALHRDGVRQFDFSIGNYAYKRRFGVVPLPLADITAALSWRGLPYALRDRAVRELRRHPRLAAQVGRALGRPPSREESLRSEETQTCRTTPGWPGAHSSASRSHFAALAAAS